MPTITNNAEGGTTGTTVTTGNSGAESGTACATVLINAGNAITFDTAAAHRGALGYKFDMGTTQPCQLTWTLATTIRTVMRFYFMAAALPSANDYIAVYRNATLGPATLTLTTANKFNVQNAAGAGISASTATNPIVANTWYRVELAITKGTTTSNGRIEYAYYIGDSTTAEFSYDSGTTVNAGTTDIASIRLGRNTAGTVAGVRYYDDIAAKDLASGWIGPPSDAVAPSGIASGETFGTAAVSTSLTASPSGIATAEAFGSAALTIPRTVSPAGIASAEAFGTAVVTKTLTVSPAGVASAQAFGTATVAVPLTIAPAGASSAEAFGTAVITKTLTVSPSGVTSGEGFGTAVIGNTGPTSVTVSPTGIATATAFGTAAVTYLTTVSPSGIASGEAVGTPTLTTALTVSPAGAASALAFGTATVAITPPATSVSVTGIASAQAFGTAAISTFLQIGPPGGVGTGEAFGIPAVTGHLTASPAGIASAQAFGSLTVGTYLTVSPNGVTPGEEFGAAFVSLPDPILTPPGIPSAEAFGTTVLSGQLSGPFVLVTSIPPARYIGDLPPQTERSTTTTRWEGSLG
jgi:hypothetical protein